MYGFTRAFPMSAWSGRLDEYLLFTVIGVVVGAVICWWLFSR
jgi:hypothetical protein